MREITLEKFIKPKKPWEVEGVEWKEVGFLDVVEILDKYRIPVKKKNRKPGSFPYCGANGIIDFVEGYTHEGEFLMLAEDGGFFGKGEKTAYIMKGKFWANNHVHVIKAKSNIDLRYLYHFSIFYDFTSHLRGATRPKLSQIGMKKIKIPIPFRNGKPDLETQKKIVEYIEANFSKIDKILEKKKEIVKQRDELWESVLEQAFKPKEGEEWGEVRLKEIAKIISGSTAPQDKKFYKDGRYPFIRVSDLGGKKNFYPLLDARDKLNEEGIKNNKLVLAPKNTIIFPKSGAAILTNSRGILGKEAYIVNHLAGIIPFENKSSPRYLLFYLSKIDMGKYISPNSSYPSLKLETIRNLKIPLPFRNGKPDLEKQKEIADYLDSIYEKIQILKEKIQNQITQLEEMKESILDEVFNHDKTR